LAQTIERMNAAKARIGRFSKTAAADYFVALYFFAQGLGAAGIRRPIANFVVSNIPGSKADLYLGGARLLGVYPMNVLAVGLGLSVTLVSRAGQLDIGFTASRTVLPYPQRIATLCAEAFDALQARAADPSATKPTRVASPAAKPGAKRGARKGARFSKHR
jgi:hypothetical protein